MKEVLTVVVIIYQVSVSLCNLDLLLPSHKFVFEYGNDYGEQTYAKNGKIGLLEKEVRIPISVPKCSVITYVRVEVDNVVGPPDVSYSKDTQNVEITYHLLQYSKSSYQIIAKSVSKPYCQTAASRWLGQKQDRILNWEN